MDPTGADSILVHATFPLRCRTRGRRGVARTATTRSRSWPRDTEARRQLSAKRVDRCTATASSLVGLSLSMP